MTRAAMILAALLLGSAPVVPGAGAGQDPETEAPPLPRVPSSLICFLGAAEPAGLEGEHSILPVGVRNPLDRAAEPLSFRLFLPGPPEAELVLARVPLPHVGRRGHPIAPGGREDYVLSVPRGPAELRGARALVETGVFFEEAPPAIETPRVSGVATRAGRDVAQLENPGAHALDLVLEATYGPARTRSIHATRLAAGERVAWAVPPPAGWSAGEATRPPRAIDVRLVDACALGPGEEGEPAGAVHELARQALGSAYSSWLGERAVADGAVGLFELDHRAGIRTLRARGRFEVVGEGVAITPLEAWGRPEDETVAREALEELLGLSERRPAIEDVLDRAAPRIVAQAATETIVAVSALPGLGLTTPALVGLREDRITWISGPALGEPPHVHWRTRSLGSGYLRVGIDRYDGAALDLLRPDHSVRWSIEDEPGPRGTRRSQPVELRRRTVDDAGTIQLATRLAVSHVGPEARQPGWTAKDEAAARQELREAWARPLRYAGPHTWSGRCERIAPKPRGDWNGRDWLSGAFVLEGLRAGGWVRGSLELVDTAEGPPDSGEELGEAASEEGEGRSREAAGPPLDAAARRQLAEGFEEQLAAWTRLDFAHRPPFELLFEGVAIRRLGPDLVLEGSPIRRVRLSGGLPVQVIEADGTRTDIEYLTVPDGVLPVRVQRRGRKLEVEHTRVGGQWLPRRLVLHGFPPAGGLETLLFEAWRRR